YGEAKVETAPPVPPATAAAAGMAGRPAAWSPSESETSTCRRTRSRTSSAAMAVTEGRRPQGRASAATAGTEGAPREFSRRALRLRPKRSEEHTSELQSRVELGCRLLLEKKTRREDW